MGQMRKPPTATSGPKMSDAEIYKQVTDYSHGVTPKPTGQSRSRQVLSGAMREVFTNTPRTVDTSASAGAQRKQKIAIAYSKARAAGARLPKK